MSRAVIRVNPFERKGKTAERIQVSKRFAIEIEEDATHCEDDAIPIDWLRNQYMVASPSDTIEYIARAELRNKIIDEIISLWKREQAEGKGENG